MCRTRCIGIVCRCFILYAFTTTTQSSLLWSGWSDDSETAKQLSLFGMVKYIYDHRSFIISLLSRASRTISPWQDQVSWRAGRDRSNLLGLTVYFRRRQLHWLRPDCEGDAPTPPPPPPPPPPLPPPHAQPQKETVQNSICSLILTGNRGVSRRKKVIYGSRYGSKSPVKKRVFKYWNKRT